MFVVADCLRRVVFVCALVGCLEVTGSARAQGIVPLGSGAAQAALPSSYVAQVLSPIQRAAYLHRSAFGSLCSLAPLACALIDRPFALNAKLELFIRPQAPDGSTSLLLPFAMSVPILGRAEVGAGSCFAMARASSDKSSQTSSPQAATPTGLCPMWVAAKGVLFPIFRDLHRHPALAAEYLFEYQAGPFVGLNQLGLPGPLSKMSVIYRHPLGALELSGAATVLVDHISRAGTLQLGAHAGYRVPFGEHLWIFGQAILKMPSWGSVLLDTASGSSTQRTIDLSPPVGGTLAIGAQQRADFGFGVGLTLMLTRSDLETRVDLLFRLLSFEVGPHIKPLFPPKPKPEPVPQVDVALHTQTPNAACPPGMQPAPQPVAHPGSSQTVDAVQCVPVPPQPRQCPPGLVPAPPPSMECVMPRLAPPSPLWGHPCEFVPFDGSPHLRVGRIDRSGEYCEWDGLRLPLGAIIAPPQPGRANTAPPPPNVPQQPSGPTSPPFASGRTPSTGHARPSPRPPVSVPQPIAATPSAPTPLGQPTSPAHASAVGPTHPAPRAQHAGDHYDPQAASVPGSPAASGFVDGAAKAIHHVAQIARVVHDHGIGAVVPSKEDAKKWMHDFKENCLDHAKDCVTHKAQEAADELNRFRKLSRDDQVYAVSSTLGEAAPGMLASAIVPGSGAVLGGVIRTGEKAAGKALLRKVGKEAVEEVAEHTDEAAAQRLLREAEERAKKQAEKRAAKEAAEADARRVAEAQAKAASEVTNAAPSRHAPLGPKGEPIDTPRTVFRRGQDGRVDHYQTFEVPSSPRDPRPTVLTKRFDGVGDAHKDVPTPHIHEPSKPGGRLDRARHPPRPDELPKGY